MLIKNKLTKTLIGEQGGKDLSVLTAVVDPIPDTPPVVIPVSQQGFPLQLGEDLAFGDAVQVGNDNGIGKAYSVDVNIPAINVVYDRTATYGNNTSVVVDATRILVIPTTGATTFLLDVTTNTSTAITNHPTNGTYQYLQKTTDGSIILICCPGYRSNTGCYAYKGTFTGTDVTWSSASANFGGYDVYLCTWRWAISAGPGDSVYVYGYNYNYVGDPSDYMQCFKILWTGSSFTITSVQSSYSILFYDGGGWGAMSVSPYGAFYDDATGYHGFVYACEVSYGIVNTYLIQMKDFAFVAWPCFPTNDPVFIESSTGDAERANYGPSGTLYYDPALSAVFFSVYDAYTDGVQDSALYKTVVCKITSPGGGFSTNSTYSRSSVFKCNSGNFVFTQPSIGGATTIRSLELDPVGYGISATSGFVVNSFSHSVICELAGKTVFSGYARGEITYGNNYYNYGGLWIFDAIPFFPDPSAVVGLLSQGGQTGDIRYIFPTGSILEGFTGQVPGAIGYIQSDGTISGITTAYPYGRFISSTRFLVERMF